MGKIWEGDKEEKGWGEIWEKGVGRGSGENGVGVRVRVGNEKREW